jgi:hypothetical protein
MGIVFYARRISEPLEQRLVHEPALTEQLTDPACDFDRALYLRPYEERGRPLPEGLFARAERLVAYLRDATSEYRALLVWSQ